ncbi:hypothetical protein FE257_010767 [Aspergillus nanangensis]|uniref:Mitochondrial division protein 1 n=1 Tax=Aspergillus nanangensis TaxID=2582783 RepID=A0AAD4GY69_ASPNN|nr:hypothetical protein FE257_010767 [Aspergillus nanangensis]
MTGLQYEISAFSQTLEPLQRLLHNQPPTQGGLLDDITKCSATFSRLRDKIDPKTSQTLLSKWEFQRWTWPMTGKEGTNVIREIERYKSLFWLALMLSQTQSLNLLMYEKIDLSWLHIVKGAAFNDHENRQIECLPGAQMEVLREINTWIKSPDGNSKRQGILGASFFFKRGEPDRENAKLHFSTLAKQLGDTIPQLIPSIQHAILDDPDISGRGLEDQFEELILQPLIALNPGHPTSTMLIVIDALDECDQDGDVRDILELLPRVQESQSVQFRFLLTSRPDLPIKLGLQQAINNHQHLIIHDIPNPDTKKMDSIYMPILNRLLTNENEEESRQLVHEFKNIIGILILLATPLSVDCFVKLLQIEIDKVQKQCKLFHSVLDVPVRSDEPVRISHGSFRGFLLDNEQKEYPFWVDKGLVHKRLTVQCLKVMQQGLRKNICNLQSDTTPRNDIDKDTLRHCLPSELQYACRYWESSAVEVFLYSIGLMFTEEDSEIKKAFNHESSTWSLVPKVKGTGTELSRWFRLVAFSRDGQLLASGANDHTVKIWDPRTGELRQTLKGHSAWVSSVSFSLDSELLASASFDQTVKVWDARTGELCRTLGGYLDEIHSVTFLSDYQETSFSGNNTVKIWDALTGELRERYD